MRLFLKLMAVLGLSVMYSVATITYHLAHYYVEGGHYKEVTSTKEQQFTIVILTMNRLNSLQRLVKSLLHPDCQYDQYHMPVNIEFHIDHPKNVADESSWLETVRWVEHDVKDRWPYGNVTALVARKNMGLRDAWFAAWTPKNDDDRAIILEDDIEVSPLWFQWVNGAYDVYASSSNIAGFSLERQDLVPLKDPAKRQRTPPTNNNKPFLYSLLGSIGFVPHARVWKDFIEWTECALSNNIDVSVDGLITTDWWRGNNKKSMWEQHLVYYMHQNNLYCLYQFPKNDSQALALHWKEKGEHFGGGVTDLGQSTVTDPEQIGSFTFPEEPTMYDWGANPMTRDGLIDSAVGPVPLGGVCMTGTDQFVQRSLPRGGSELLKKAKLVETTRASPFLPAQEVLSLCAGRGYNQF